MTIKLYTSEGFTHQGERLGPVLCANGEELLEKLFELTNAGKTVVLIREDSEPEGLNYMITIRNKDEHRKYIASIFAELTANFKLTI